MRTALAAFTLTLVLLFAGTAQASYCNNHPTSPRCTTPPNTTISAVTDNDSATLVDEDGNGSEAVSVSFSGTNTPSSFTCSVSGATTIANTSCSSPWQATVNVGSNTVTVTACNSAGCDATPASNTFTMQAGSPPPPPADRLEYTTRTDHTGYSDLSGATLQTNTQYCVTLKDAADVVAPVNFYLDGTFMRTENTSPWDATNTFSTGACGTMTFSSGSHTISATWPNGGNTADTFSVAGPLPQCSDGIDNADPEDTLIDYPADPGCSSSTDNDETDVPSGSVPWGPSGSWRLVFEDDFTQDPTGAVDSTKWTNSGWNNCTTSIADGAPDGGRALDMFLPVTADNNGCQITSRFSFTYGAIEARVYFPMTPDGRAANHAGWWTYGNTASSGEIDVMESGWCFIHNGSGGNATQGSVAGTWVGAWHTFTASWEPDGNVTIWWDGQVACHASNLGWDNQPIKIWFNHFIQPGYNLYAPAHMWAKYARIWQR